MASDERRFRDRIDAGRALAGAVDELDLHRPIVLGLPRGGVPVASEVARRIDAPLDVIVARKVGMPGHPEYAIGAVAEGGDGVVLTESVAELGVDERAIEAAASAAIDEMRRRVRSYRSGDLPDLAGRSVVVVDDGLATGATAEAAVRAVRARGADDVVVAVPVGALDSVRRLGEVATVVCLSTPDRFTAVGLWYDDFSQTSDAEVLGLLGRG